MSIHALINEFLSRKRFAFIGLSGNSREISRYLYDEFLKQGYNPLPVNPALGEIDGNKSYPSVGHIEPKVEAALIMTNSEIALKIIEECSQAGITLIWLYGRIGTGAAGRKAVALCNQKNIRVIPGFCPYMFLPNAGLIHRLHRFFIKLGGKYPQ